MSACNSQSLRGVCTADPPNFMSILPPCSSRMSILPRIAGITPGILIVNHCSTASGRRVTATSLWYISFTFDPVSSACAGVTRSPFAFHQSISSTPPSSSISLRNASRYRSPISSSSTSRPVTILSPRLISCALWIADPVMLDHDERSHWLSRYLRRNDSGHCWYSFSEEGLSVSRGSGHATFGSCTVPPLFGGPPHEHAGRDLDP